MSTSVMASSGIFKACLSVAVSLVVGIASVVRAQPPWQPVPGKLMTRWAKEVDPASPLPEYPRPSLVRDRWESLNGVWQGTIRSRGHGHDAGGGVAWSGAILVPFPAGSSLSGVGRALGHDEVLEYTRTVTIPSKWQGEGERILLHFGAVDWRCRVKVNGKFIGEHTGGYDPFSFDITDALKASGENEIRVEVTDPTNHGGQPRGKQWSKPHGIWYTPAAGIWQTVWLEPVPATRIAAVRVEADLATGSALIHVERTGPDVQGVECRVEVGEGGSVVAQGASAGQPIRVRIPNVRAWSPDSPTLYDLSVSVLAGPRRVDSVRSYFAYRNIAVAKDSQGVNRLMLNGKPTFMFGPLDQGYWPDGIYTAPTDEALRSDIEAVKRMGGNMLRKHVKVEPERFYYWCDSIGVMVWQDMPSAFFEEIKADGTKGWDDDFPAISAEWKANFESEWRAILESRRSHPSIVMWVPFNEGWGQNDLSWAKAVVERTKAWDPTRLVNNASGWTDMKVGDVVDLHAYPNAAKPANEPTRAAVLGEFGGLGLPLSGHTWVDKDNWGYQSFKTKEELTKAYIELMDQLPPLIAEGLCAAVYTQTTDVEVECNGWMTYDRAVWKVDPDRAGPATRAALSGAPMRIRVVLPRAGQESGPGLWAHSTTSVEGWNMPECAAAASWETGPGGFGSKGTPGAIIGTEWTGKEVYLRRSFDAPAENQGRPPNERNSLYLSIHHDEDAEVYLNGVLAAKLSGYTTTYTRVPISEEARRALRWGGSNLIAIRCSQKTGGQYIDCGIVEIVREGEPSKHGTRPEENRQPTAGGARPREDITNYESRTLAGYPLMVNKELITGSPELLERVLVQLHADLDEITHFVPKAAGEALRGVTIWIERRGSAAMAGGRGMCCHWSPAWLRMNGLLPEKAGGVEIINAEDFLSWRRDQPYMCFHEMAHALHCRLSGLDKDIEGAFTQAKNSKRYERVPRNTLPAGKTESAYAITNSHEYFAELSEAYFALNDFYPFTRAQLSVHDPEGYKLIERVWGLSRAEIEKASVPREPAAR